MAVSRRSMVATDNFFSAHEARYSAKSAGLAGITPPLAEKFFKSEAYARFVALDWLAAMKRSAVAEKPFKTASGGFAGARLVGAAVLVALVAVASAFCVEILVILKGFLAVDNCVLSLPEF